MRSELTKVEETDDNDGDDDGKIDESDANVLVDGDATRRRVGSQTYRIA